MNKNAPSSAAKDRLLDSAIKIFALYGYQGASTRQLAKEAAINLSSIRYYFGDKEGLYKAALAHIASLVRMNADDKIVHLQNALNNKALPKSECKKLLYEVIGSFTHFLLGDKITSHMAVLFLREQMEPTAHFDVIYESTMRPLHEALTSLVARLTGLPSPSEQATLCAHTLLGQIAVYKTHREAALRRLKWKNYGPSEKDKILQIILRHTDCILEMYTHPPIRRRPA